MSSKGDSGDARQEQQREHDRWCEMSDDHTPTTSDDAQPRFSEIVLHSYTSTMTATDIFNEIAHRIVSSVSFDDINTEFAQFIEQLLDDERKKIAAAIWQRGQQVNALVYQDPTNARLNGSLQALQDARDIAERGGEQR